MVGNFEGKSIVITGAAEGIGYALCEYFAKQKAHVTITDINEIKLKTVIQKLNDQLGDTRVVGCCVDGSDIKKMHDLLNNVRDRTGSLDAVIFNAGITNYGGFLEYDEERFDRIVDLNLKGSYFTAQQASKIMIANGIKGRLILLGSITGIQAFPNLSAYGITKAGIAHMAKCIAMEVGKYGITCNAISPGATVTPRTVDNDPHFEKNWAAVSMTQNVTRVEDIVAAAAYLASSGARQVTGQNIIVDGGWTMTSPIPNDHPDEPEYEYETN